MTETKFDPNDPRALAEFCVRVLDSKNASDIRLFYVEEQTIVADYYVICCGRSTTHVSALSDELEYQAGLHGKPMTRVEGRNGGTWVLMDYDSVLVHIFTRDTRDFYKLEKLYSTENEIDIKNLLTDAKALSDSEDREDEASEV